MAPTRIVSDVELCCRQSSNARTPGQFLARDDGQFLMAGPLYGPTVWLHLYSSDLKRRWEKRLYPERICHLAKQLSEQHFFFSCLTEEGGHELFSVDDDGNVASLFAFQPRGTIALYPFAVDAVFTDGQYYGSFVLNRLDAAGSVSWTRVMEEVDVRELTYQEGRVIAAGSIRQEDGAYVVGLDADGEKLWEHVLDCESRCSFDSVRPAGDGEFLLKGIDRDAAPPFATYDWFALVTRDGELRWDTRSQSKRMRDLGWVQTARRASYGIEVILRHTLKLHRTVVLHPEDGRIVHNEEWPEQWQWDVCTPEVTRFHGDRDVAILMSCFEGSCSRGNCVGESYARMLIVR